MVVSAAVATARGRARHHAVAGRGHVPRGSATSADSRPAARGR